jgi:hypothetical protein
MFSCLLKKPSTTIRSTITNPGYNVARDRLHIGNSTESGAIKAKTTFVTRIIDPQFGRYIGQGGTVLSNF